jgi:hypothetical protein
MLKYVVLILHFNAESFWNETMYLFTGFWLWSLVLRHFQQYFSSIHPGNRFYWWKKQEYPKKTTDLTQVTDKLYHIMLYQVHFAMSRIQTHNLSGDIFYLDTYKHDHKIGIHRSTGTQKLRKNCILFLIFYIHIC